MQGRMDGRTTDNRPWHKLAGLRQVELKMGKCRIVSKRKMNMTGMIRVVFESEVNMVGNGENTGYQHFLLFPQYLLKPSLYGKMQICNE